MALTIPDFHDLSALPDMQPELQADIRRLALKKDISELPERLERLSANVFLHPSHQTWRKA